MLERFSLERLTIIAFTLTTQPDWFKKLVPLFDPIRSKPKTIVSLAHFFPHFMSVTSNFLEF